MLADVNLSRLLFVDEALPHAFTALNGIMQMRPISGVQPFRLYRGIPIRYPL